MTVNLTHEFLKTKQRELRDGFPETMGLRVHRAISWIDRAERCDDDDARFIFLWIAFNAAYADEQVFHQAVEDNSRAISMGERRYFDNYFKRLVKLDKKGRIRATLWQQFSGPIRVLMENRYVFNPFWKHHNKIKGFGDWGKLFIEDSKKFKKAFEKGDTANVLKFVFERLYVLRNQLVHGGSTWNSRVNRDQVRDGAAILGFLIPMFIDIMMDNPSKKWGKPFYPVVE